MSTFVKGAALLGVLGLCAGLAAGSTWARVQTQKPPEREEAETLSPEALARTRVLFDEKCARCHGTDGRGKTATGEMLGVPDFTDEEWWKEGKSGKRLVTSVTEGRDGMPPFGKKLTSEEIAALVAYVRRFNKAGR
jgi:mono/diheme cytochrome c family protein